MGAHNARVRVAGQRLVETGKAVDVTLVPAQAPVAVVHPGGVGDDQTRDLSTIERADVKGRAIVISRDWRHNDHNLPKDNGGGYHPATSVHSPLYYSALIPGTCLAAPARRSISCSGCA